MAMRYLTVIFLAVLAAGCGYGTDRSPQQIVQQLTRPNPTTAIESALSALNACDVDRLLKLRLPYKPPNHSFDSEEWTRDCKAAVSWVGNGRAALTFAKQLRPVYSKDGLVATYDLKGLQLDQDSRPLELILYNGQWYFSDM